jgi:peroxiredoxin
MANLAIGDQAVDFDLPGIDDKNHTLADYVDKELVAVIFSCNHCPYVLAWEDRLIETQRDYADRGVQFILINSNDPAKYAIDDFPHMKTHAQDKGFPFPYLYDESQEIARAYGAERTPEIFLFDRARRLGYHGAPDDNYDDPSMVTSHYLRDALDALLKGGSPAVTQTPPVGCTIKWRP